MGEPIPKEEREQLEKDLGALLASFEIMIQKNHELMCICGQYDEQLKFMLDKMKDDNKFWNRFALTLSMLVLGLIMFGLIK